MSERKIEVLTTEGIAQAIALLTTAAQKGQKIPLLIIRALAELVVRRGVMDETAENLTGLRDEIMSLRDRQMIMTEDELMRRLDEIRDKAIW